MVSVNITLYLTDENYMKYRNKKLQINEKVKQLVKEEIDENEAGKK